MFSSKRRKRSQKLRAGYETEEVPEKPHAKPDNVTPSAMPGLVASRKQEGHATVTIRLLASVSLVAKNFHVETRFSTESEVAWESTIAQGNQL